MKLVFLGTSFAIVYHMRYNRLIKVTYDKEQDTFRHYFLVLPCFGLAALIHQKATLLEVGWAALRPCWQAVTTSTVQVLWTFSIYLEAVAILPQLVLLQRTQNIDNLTGNYVFLLG
jgi:ER lumen protein retaining receptor